jgi:hypothetical protein
MADLAEARRMADEHAVRMAGRALSEPLLQGMSIPRIRLGDVTVDLPVGIEGVQAAEHLPPPSAATVRGQAIEALREAADRNEIKLPRGAITAIGEQIQSRLDQAPGDLVGRAELFSRVVNEAIIGYAMREEAQMRRVDAELLSREVRTSIAAVAVRSIGTPAGLQVAVESARVRDLAAEGLTTTLRLVLREEGVDVNEVMLESGETVMRLTPE